MAWEFLSRAAKIALYVQSGATKTAWDVLSGMANRCGMFCPGCQKMAWDVLSWDVLSYIHKVQMRRLGIHTQKFQGCELELHTYIPLAPHCSLWGPTTSPFLSTLSQLIWGTFSMQ